VHSSHHLAESLGRAMATEWFGIAIEDAPKSTPSPPVQKGDFVEGVKRSIFRIPPITRG